MGNKHRLGCPARGCDECGHARPACKPASACTERHRSDYAELLAERDAMQSIATQATREVERLRAALASSEECVAKLETSLAAARVELSEVNRVNVEVERLCTDASNRLLDLRRFAREAKNALAALDAGRKEGP